jgi:hypothetical protein
MGWLAWRGDRLLERVGCAVVGLAGILGLGALWRLVAWWLGTGGTPKP